MTYALIPAAGRSRRMGRPKLALPLGDRTVLEHVLAALRQAEVEPVLVVLGPQSSSLGPAAASAGAQILVLAEETAEMRATVEQGLRWLEERFAPAAEEDWLLVPADHPALDPEVVRQLIRARAAHPDRSLVVPVFQGERGHPVLIAWKHVAGIRALPPGRGLDAYLRAHPAETLHLPVASPEILCDLDTPADYERLRQDWQKRGRS